MSRIESLYHFNRNAEAKYFSIITVVPDTYKYNYCILLSKRKIQVVKSINNNVVKMTIVELFFQQ